MRRWFALEEIESSELLQNLYWVLLFGFFLTFSEWIGSPAQTLQAVAKQRHVCPPYFQDCASLYFFSGWPHHVGQAIVYTLLTTLLAGSALAAYYKKWSWALALMIPAFLWKLAVIGLLTYQTHMDFEYFHLPEVFIFLFLRRKEFFIRRAFVLIYFMAATMKFTESWIVGSYFTSLSVGLPLFPDAIIPWITNAIAIFEIISPWFLLSRNSRLRLATVGLWTIFHLYSIILVEFRYPAHCLPLLWLLFLPAPSPPEPKSAPKHERARRVQGGWAFLLLLLSTSAIPRLQTEDWLYTLDGKKFSVGMFAANYQCVSNERWIFRDGRESEHGETSTAAMHRCEPYRAWFRLRERCRSREDLERIAWTFSTSINGGPFYRIVDVENACALSYKLFGENDWIRTPSQGAPVVGYPAKNTLLKSSPKRFTEAIFEHPRIELSTFQTWLQIHLKKIIFIYWCLWFTTLIAAAISDRRANSRYARQPRVQ